ncbi:MAG: fused NADH-quinone oxidoreductase subunit E/endonuclease, partial [Pseudomonadota bacterium]
QGEADDLQLLKGVGPKMEASLNEMGVYHFAQIADWTPAEVKAVDVKLGAFKGRIARDQLIEQAKLLAAGRVTEYEASFGKLGLAS